MIDYREDNQWTVYVHIVPKEIRSSDFSDDLFDKYYVGITSRDPEERWAGNGREYKNQVFYNAIKKYGWDNIQHIIITSHLTEQEAKNFEIKLIQELKSFIKDGHGYNATRGGEGFLGVQHFGEDNPFYGKHHSEESRKKMSLYHQSQRGKVNHFYGKHHTEETKKLLSEIAKARYKEHPEIYANRPSISEERKKQIGIEHSKAVYVFDMNLNFLNEYRSIREASQKLGLTYRVACLMVYDEREYDKDYIIRYKDQVPDIKDFQKTYKVRIKPEKQEIENPVYQFDSNYNYIKEFKNEFVASKETNIPLEKIQKSISFIVKEVDGYIFRRANYISNLDQYISVNQKILTLINPIVIQYDQSGNKIGEYRNIYEASKITGVHYGTIQRSCHFDRDNGDYIWRFKGGDHND